MTLSTAAAFAQVAYTNGYEFTEGTGYALPEYPFVTPPELTQQRVGRHSVVIVGGGISGLTLACGLANLGVPAVLLDEDNTVGVKGASSRGICYTQKSLEIFQRYGIFDRIAGKGIEWSVGRTFAGHDEVFSFDLKAQSNFNLSRQPAFINIQQFYIEGYLVERIAELNRRRPSVDLRWSSRVVGFEQNAERALLSIETPQGSYQIEAEHVIDATGSHTPFHGWVGAQLDSKRGDDRWCIADVKFKTTPPTERHTWIEAPFNENRAVWQHLMGDQVWRIDYQMAPNADPAYVSREDVVLERLKRQFGGDVQCDIVWVGPYAYRSQCVRQMRVGRVFFMGDTAKVVSPFGARGGNTGIADADNLAWKLAAVVRGQAPAILLNSYHDERLEAAQRNVQVTNRTARFLRPTDPAAQTFRQATLALAKKHRFARHMVNTGRMAEANSYSRSPACAGGGVSVQNVTLRWANGRSAAFNELLNWADGALLLLVFGPLSGPDVARLRQLAQHTPLLRVVQVVGQGQKPQAVEHIVDHQAVLRQACRAIDRRWALVRPDAYLAATGLAMDGLLVQSVARSLAMAR
ncbi:MAG: 3-(3-hydroxy-phenyl)propionate/3-hydroxycinnamic acid hydroxylase [Pseudomonadota bacterium]|jgi:3-(3-hydroxy-phenyl)propionate hydroxylase